MRGPRRARGRQRRDRSRRSQTIGLTAPSRVVYDAAVTVIGLMLQAVALVLLFKTLGRSWLTHIGAIFVVAAVTYHGFAEIALWLVPGRDPYRFLIAASYVDQFVLWISAAILLFTVTYLAVLRHHASQSQAPRRGDNPRMPSIFGWKLTLVALIPLAVISLQGTAVHLQTQGAGTSFGLAEQFFLPAVVLAGYEFIARFGRRWLIPVLIVQCALISVIVAERLSILVAVVVMLYILARFGTRLSRAQLLLGGVAVVLLGVGITAARADEGRFTTSANASGRFQSFVAGFESIGSVATWQAVAGDIGYRLDGNSFGAMELAALASRPPLGAAPLVNDIFEAVPSFLDPQKDAAAPASRSDKVYAEEHLNLFSLELAPNSWLDILPTQLGDIMGFGGPGAVLFAAILLGGVFALADRWLLRSLTPTRMLIGLGLLMSVLFYERSWDTYIIILRGIIPLLVVALVFSRLRTARASRRAPIVQRGGLRSESGL
jgi:hypothetical protein